MTQPVHHLCYAIRIICANEALVQMCPKSEHAMNSGHSQQNALGSTF